MADRFRTTLDWEDVRFFVALARHRTLSATARALGVNHATVARRVTGLETGLGTALFERRADGYALTQAGQNLLAPAHAMEASAEAMAAAPAATGLSGRLRLTAPPTLADLFLTPELAGFQASHPGLEIEIRSDLRSLSLARLEADLALRYGRPEDGDIIARRLVAIRFDFYAAPIWRERLAGGAPPALVGFGDVDATVPEALWLAQHFSSAGFALRTNSHAGQARAAAAGAGIALLPHFVAATLPGLAPVDLGAAPPERTLWLLARQDVRTSAKIAAARDFLVELFARRRALFEGGD
jgi:DNA-binding transcriptional LysR family regulator